jgi:iron(II)-dependent oxidoreductase
MTSPLDLLLAMRRFISQAVIPKTVNHALFAAAAVAALAGWLAGYWLLGAGIAFTVLCVAGTRATTGQQAANEASQQSSAAETNSERAPPANLSLVEELISQGRTALLLRPQIAEGLSARDLRVAQDELDEVMAMVPEGPVALRGRSADAEGASNDPPLVLVEGLFLDRYAVTNREYHAFVSAGGYEQMSLWDEAIWPAVLGFIDRTGHPGPRYWENGTYKAGKEDHPVVGVSWYEASAFARWVGKRLPTDAEWVKAASWPVFAESRQPVQRRFPWGDAMDRKRVNIWGSGNDATVPVRGLPAGASVNGVEQLVGNVWEWTSSSFGAWENPGQRIETDHPLKSIRGGAFDTYFESQANCHFQSGAGPLDRKHNVGFRCALGFCDVVNMGMPEEDTEICEAGAGPVVASAGRTQPFSESEQLVLT